MIKQHKITLPKNSSQVILGFSGGADSTALAQLLYQNKILFQAVHFNHHLREDAADNDAKFCYDFCMARSIPFTEKHIYVQEEKQGSESIETCARRLRQNFYQQKFAKKNTVVLLAHHSGDLRENFLLRALRGSSSSGLSGLRENCTIQGVNYFRPLLKFSKEEILEYLNEQELQWREDESNAESIYARNLMRNEVLPSMAKIASLEGLDRCLINVAHDADFMEESAQNWLLKNSFTRDNFLKVHPALKARILRYYFQQHNIEYIPGHEALTRLEKELSKDHRNNISIQLEKNIYLMLDTNGEIWLKNEVYCLEWNWQKENSLRLPNGRRLSLSKEKSEGSEGFATGSLPETLVVRTYKSGDRMIAFGKKSPRKIKDFFSQRKISPQMRQQLPLICTGGTIIWVPNVKRAEFGRYSTNDSVVYFTYE